jgi:hypothetical protein
MDSAPSFRTLKFNAGAASRARASVTGGRSAARNSGVSRVDAYGATLDHRCASFTSRNPMIRDQATFNILHGQIERFVRQRQGPYEEFIAEAGEINADIAADIRCLGPFRLYEGTTRIHRIVIARSPLRKFDGGST